MLLPLEGRRGRPALVTPGETVSFGDLDRAARAHAARLAAERLPAGARVAVVAHPDAATVAAIAGNAMAGHPTVPLAPTLGERELAHVLADSAPALILTSRPDGRIAGVRAIELGGPAPPVGREEDPADPLLVLYTSGTTGLPKGAVLTRENVRFDLDALAEAWALTEGDVLTHALPLFHVHGLVLGVLGSLRAGMTLRLLPRFSPEDLCASFQAGATVLYAVPTMYHRLAEHLESTPAAARAFDRARLLVSGSAALPAREHARIAALTGHAVAERYGLTETLIVCAVRADGDRRAGAVGAPLPGLELKLAGETGAPAAPGELGEVLVRGPSVFAGYLNRADATAAAIDAEGFFHTGDLAHLDPDGYVRIAGRKATDLIKTGGFKVGAGEVEAALLEHPAVREAAVVGAADPDLGERIVAYVVARSPVSAEELIDHVARSSSPHKRPREVRFVEELPRNAMGKVMKKELRQCV